MKNPKESHEKLGFLEGFSIPKRIPKARNSADSLGGILLGILWRDPAGVASVKLILTLIHVITWKHLSTSDPYRVCVKCVRVCTSVWVDFPIELTNPLCVGGVCRCVSVSVCVRGGGVEDLSPA